MRLALGRLAALPVPSSAVVVASVPWSSDSVPSVVADCAAAPADSPGAATDGAAGAAACSSLLRRR